MADSADNTNPTTAIPMQQVSHHDINNNNNNNTPPTDVSSAEMTAVEIINADDLISRHGDDDSQDNHRRRNGGRDCDSLHSHPGHQHYSHRSPWLRAALMGANDGLVSTAALMLGISAAENQYTVNGRYQMVLAGLAGLSAGAFSMAVGEYVSVHSQRDSELADIEREKREFLKSPQAREREERELAKIYEERGLSAELAAQVAAELHLKSLDSIVKVHARDELGIDTEALSNPVQAAVMSAITFSIGAGIPLLSSAFIESYLGRIIAILISSTLTLLVIGGSGAKIGGAPVFRAAARVLIGGWLAMAATFGVGKAFGVSTG